VSYNPQVKGVGENQWTGNGLYFATPEEALAYAADLQSRWMGCKGGAENRRAEPSDAPVNYVWTEERGAVSIKRLS
jgi:hypothetical protein